MMICRYFVWFIVYSFFGWIYESAYCTIKGHKWENRGFLYGPIVPIYGVGALLASIVFSALPVNELQHASNLQIFIICFLGSIVLEYSTSWLLEKLFHAYWWDYSNVFCNINGRVCLPASIGFGVAGLLVVHVFLPLVNNLTAHTHSLVMEVLALGFMLLMGMDLALTVSALTDFAKNVQRIEQEINDQMTIFYDNLEDRVLETRDSLVEKKESFIEMKEQFQEGAFVKKELRSEEAASFKEKLTLQYLSSMASHASFTQKRTLAHIKGFKQDGHSKTLRERMVQMLDDHRKDNKTNEDSTNI